MARLLTIVIGLLGGIAVGTQNPMVGSIGQKVGGAAGSVIVHVTGAIFALLLLVLNRGENIQNWRSIPWWMFSAGFLGVFLMLSINYTIPRIGAAAAISLVIVGQLTAGVVVDHFGLLGAELHAIDGSRAVGMVVLLAGSYLIVR